MIDIDFKFYFSLLWRRLPLVLLVWLTIASLAIFVAYILPPVFQSQAKILVTSPRVTLVEGTVNASSNEIIASIQQRLLTRNNLLGIAERFNVFPPGTNLSPTDRLKAMHRAIAFDVETLGDAAAVRRGATAATSFWIAFFADNPRTATDVTNELVTQILQANQEIRTGSARETREFFEREDKRLREELASLELEISYFKSENSDALPDSLEFRRNEQSRIQQRLLQLDSQELAQQEQRTQLQRTLDDPTLLAALNSSSASPNVRALATAKQELASNLSIFSENHPTVIALQARIATLEAQIQSENADTSSSASQSNQIRDSIEDIEANLRFITGQRVDLEAQLEALKQSIAQTPNVEIQLNNLDRRYASLDREFRDNLTRLSAANTGQTLEDSQQSERFEVIENPTTPDEPISPPRLLIAIGGIFAGLAAGLGLVVLLDLILNNSIRRPIELTNRLGIEPFATIPYIATRAEIRRRRLKAAFGFALVAVGIPAALYAVHYYYLPLDLIISKVATRFGIDGLTQIFS